MDLFSILTLAVLAWLFWQLLSVKRMARNAGRQLPVLTQQVAHAAAVMTVTALFAEDGDHLVPIGRITKNDATTLVQYLADNWQALDEAAVNALRSTLPRS